MQVTTDELLATLAGNHHDGTRTAGLQLIDSGVQALLHRLLIFRLHPAGFSTATGGNFSPSPKADRPAEHPGAVQTSRPAS
jgi:hypothetical protein